MIKKLVDKYSFLGSYGVLAIFLISGLIPVFIHDIGIVMSSMGFVGVFWIKYLVKSKFDVLRFDINSKVFLISYMMTLGFIFLVEPLLIFVFKLRENMGLRDIISGTVMTAFSFAFLFTLYNGYTPVLIDRIRKVLIGCAVLITMLMLVLCVRYADLLILWTCFEIAFLLFYMCAYFAISRKPYIEVAEGKEIYRYTLKEGKEIVIYRELFKAIFVPVRKYKNYFKLCDFELSEEWKNLAERLQETPVDSNKQLIINCFFENPVFCLKMASQNENKAIFKRKARKCLLLTSIFLLLINYRMSLSDVVSSVLALTICFASIEKFYYCLYLERKWLHNRILAKTVAFSIFIAAFVLSNKINFIIQVSIFFITFSIFVFQWVQSKAITNFMEIDENYEYFSLNRNALS